MIVWILLICFLPPLPDSQSATRFRSEKRCIMARNRAIHDLGPSIARHVVVRCVPSASGEDQKP